MEFSQICNMVKIEKKIFRQLLTSYLWTFSRFSTTSLQHKWNAKILLLPKGEFTSCQTTGDLKYKLIYWSS